MDAAWLERVCVYVTTCVRKLTKFTYKLATYVSTGDDNGLRNEFSCRLRLGSGSVLGRVLPLEYVYVCSLATRRSGWTITATAQLTRSTPELSQKTSSSLASRTLPSQSHDIHAVGLLSLSVVTLLDLSITPRTSCIFNNEL